MRSSCEATALLPQEINDEIGIKEAHSRGRRAGCRCRSFTCASMCSRVSSCKVRDGRARKSAAAVLRRPKCSFINPQLPDPVLAELVVTEVPACHAINPALHSDSSLEVFESVQPLLIRVA